MNTLRRTITIPGTLDTVFEFFNRPENLEQLTPASLKFRMLTPSPVAMHNGAVLDYVIRLMGLPLRWTSVITGYDPPHEFVDVQLRGPYAFWHHRHRFESAAEGVDVIDEIHYEIGFSLVGRWLLKPIIQRQLSGIFSYRTHMIEGIFGDSEA